MSKLYISPPKEETRSNAEAPPGTSPEIPAAEEASPLDAEAADIFKDIPKPAETAIADITPATEQAEEDPLEAPEAPPVQTQIPEELIAHEAPPPPHTLTPKKQYRLLSSLIVALLSTAALTVYGVVIADTVTDFKTPLEVFLAEEVLGVGITRLNGTYTAPPLQMIPPQQVEDGEKPGAAEHETAPPSASPLPDSGQNPIREIDLSVEEGEPFAIINETPYTPDAFTLLAEGRTIPTLAELTHEYGADAPVVLIIHTHGTESFSPEGAEYYSSADTFRSNSPDESVVSLGRIIKEELTARGIGVIHLENMFDLEDYNSAYYKAASEIRRYTEAYPSISYVLDIHRDAMITGDGVSLKPLSSSGEAQIMFVVGTDYAGSGHTGWSDNMALALRLQESLIGRRPTLMRAINLRSASFNEQYTKGSLLIEIGAAGNSLSEAKAASRLLAEVVANEIIG